MPTLPQLVATMPHVPLPRAAAYLPYLQASLVEFEINTPAREAAYLAQIAHESGELRWLEELASGKAYEGRTDLGNDQPGDGPRYKGRGVIMLTGKRNYKVAGQALGLDLLDNPALAAQPEAAFRLGGWFWQTHNCNTLADNGNFPAITKVINGGLTHEAEREAYWARAKIALALRGLLA
jgi:putative chitinase